MKKHYLFIAVTALLAFASCTQSEDTSTTEQTTSKKTIRFTVNGDFSSPTFTRGTLSADGKSMTDLWVFDYMNGSLVAQYHQSAEDEDFGAPEIALDYGSHHLYFVASRGKTPAVNTTDHKISWATTSDTFYKDVAVVVSTGSAAAQNITLDRIATKLGITITDAMPADISTVTITPATWYYGVDYLTGTPTDAQNTPREIAIAESSVGKTNVSLSVFGLSAATEWTSNITIVAQDSEDNILGQAAISNAPFKANRATNYSGNLFESNNAFTLALTAAWDEAHNDTW